MAEPGYVLEHPNREKGAAKATRLLVLALLVISIVLMLVVSIGGWARLEGAKALQITFIVLYVVLALFVARWSRGVLPVIAAVALVLAIFAGVTVTEWFARDKPGFEPPALGHVTLGVLTGVLVIVQVLLVATAVRGFQQAWNVEVERPLDAPVPA